MGATQRKFSREFQVEAVRQLKAGQRLAEVARELGVHVTVVINRNPLARSENVSTGVGWPRPGHAVGVGSSNV